MLYKSALLHSSAMNYSCYILTVQIAQGERLPAHAGGRIFAFERLPAPHVHLHVRPQFQE